MNLKLVPLTLTIKIKNGLETSTVFYYTFKLKL